METAFAGRRNVSGESFSLIVFFKFYGLGIHFLGIYRSFAGKNGYGNNVECREDDNREEI